MFRGEKIKDYISRREKAKIKSFLEEYLRIGGFPEVVLGKISEKEFKKEYVNTVLYRDFIERFKIENPEVARFVLCSIIQSNTSKLSINRIYRQIKQITKVSNKTVRKYVNLLQETLFVFYLRKFTRSLKLSYITQPKVYLCDLLLELEASAIGRKMENIVLLDLIRKEHEINQNLFYFQTKEGYEVDFLIKEGNRVKQLIQVTYANDFNEIDKREIRALLHARELLKQDNPELIALTWNYGDEKELSWFGKKGKIKFIPLWKWLLNMK